MDGFSAIRYQCYIRKYIFYMIERPAKNFLFMLSNCTENASACLKTLTTDMFSASIHSEVVPIKGPISADKPVSSNNSRVAVSIACSPHSIPPPGKVHEPDTLCPCNSNFVSRIRSKSSTRTTYAAALCQFISMRALTPIPPEAHLSVLDLTFS